jgi:CHAT domain-containing protein/tetratricopeptide (TPR) repeat protein
VRKTETLKLFKNGYTSEQICRRCRLTSQLACSFLLLVVCLVTGRAETPPQIGNGEPIGLTDGAVIKRELTAGAKDLFGISVSRGHLLSLSIVKGDLALSVTFYDPSGQKLLKRVGYREELLDLSLLAEAAGTYLLEVCSLELNDLRRQYELKLEPMRPASTRDQKSNMAQMAAASASILRADWTENWLRQAVEKHDEAALIWLSSNDLRKAAAATMEAAEVCVTLGEFREALRRYQKARAQAKNAGARLEESKALSEMGLLYSYLGDNDQAQKHVLDALKLIAFDSQADRPATNRRNFANSLCNLGEISYSKGDLLKSSKHFEDALKLFNEIGDRSGAARVHLFIGYISGGLGAPEKAVAELSEAIGLYRAIGNKTGEGLCLTALGLSHSLNRNEEQAIRMHREAIDIFHGVGDRQSEAIATVGLGQAYENLMEYPTAVDNYQKALRLFQDQGTLDFAATTMLNIARGYRLGGDLNQALAYYEKCLKLSRAARKVRTEANALNDLAVLYAAQGNREKTIQQYRKILRFYASISDRRRQAMGWNNLGDSYFRFGEKQEALRSYKRALPLSEQSGDKGVEISSLYNIARTQRDLGALEPGLASIEKSIKIIEDLRTNVANQHFRISYFSGVRKHYDLCIDILMQLDRERPGQGFKAAGLLTSEKARARSLVDTLTELRADIRPGASPELLARERYLSGLLRAQALYQMDRSISGADSAETEEVARHVNQLRTEYQEIDSQVKDQSARFPGPGQSPPLSLDQIQAQLHDSDTILLEYALGDERSYLWAVTANSLHSYELPARSILEDAGREIYKLLTARQEVSERSAENYQTNVEESDRAFYEKAQNLSRLLLGQVADQLGTKRIVIVTEGILQYIPFDALPAPQAKIVGPIAGNTSPASAEDPPLLATNEIVTLPSMSTLAAIRQQRPKAGASDKIVVVFADPVFNGQDERLHNRTAGSNIASSELNQNSNQLALRSLAGLVRNGGPRRLLHASEEADAILAVTPWGTSVVARDFHANRETAMKPFVGAYQIVHFATHGFFNSEHPELSGIVLSMVKPDGSTINGFMPLQDIYKLNLSAQLVVLSACDTALGKDVKGEGLVSLTRGFIYAGSKSVVTSLWKVDDRATAELMKNFYAAMLQDGMTPAAALRSAKRKIREEKAWSAPFFWAGFVLQGEYKEPIVVGSYPSPRMGLVVSVALVLISAGVLALQRRRRAPLLDR